MSVNIFEENKEAYKKFFDSLTIELKNYLGLNVTLSKRKYKSIKECKKDLDIYCTSLINLELKNYYNKCPMTQRYIVSELLSFIEEGGEFSYITYMSELEIDKKIFSLWNSKNRKGKLYSFNYTDADARPAKVHVDLNKIKQ